MTPEDDALDLDLDNLGDPETDVPTDPADPQDPLQDPEEPEEPQEPESPQDPETPADPTQRAVPRSETRIRTLVEENRRKDAELSDVRRRLDELTGQFQASRQPGQESPEQRATRLSLLSPEERIREELRESTVQHTRDLQLMQFQLQESSDRASFEAKATVDPLYKKWQPKIEAELANLRRQNQNTSRENLLYFMVGKAAIAARDGAGSRSQRRAADARMRKATIRPANTRSDAGTPARARQTQSLEKRLENVQI